MTTVSDAETLRMNAAVAHADRKLRAALYARVSTGAQDHAQLDDLRRLAEQRGYVTAEYIDTATGSGARVLPERARLIADARDGRLDLVMVWRLDRLGRSTRDLLEVIENFGAWGVGVLSVKEALDTTTPAGKLVFTIFASIAEFERALIVERVRAGQEAARRRGRLPGRPRRHVDLHGGRADVAGADVDVRGARRRAAAVDQ